MGYERIALFRVENVLPFIGNHKRLYAGTWVSMGSQRYQVFSRSLACSCPTCSLVGAYFALERSVWGKRQGPVQHNRPYHFNLYAVNAVGKEVLMTKDHVIPKAHGGTDTLGNYATMCTRCNCKKADKMPTIVPATLIRRGERHGEESLRRVPLTGGTGESRIDQAIPGGERRNAAAAESLERSS